MTHDEYKIHDKYLDKKKQNISLLKRKAFLVFPCREKVSIDYLIDFQYNAMTTNGDCKYFKSLLPKLIENISLDSITSLDSICFSQICSKLSYAAWLNWPQKEVFYIRNLLDSIVDLVFFYDVTIKACENGDISPYYTTNSNELFEWIDCKTSIDHNNENIITSTEVSLNRIVPLLNILQSVMTCFNFEKNEIMTRKWNNYNFQKPFFNIVLSQETKNIIDDNIYRCNNNTIGEFLMECHQIYEKINNKSEFIIFNNKKNIRWSCLGTDFDKS